MCSSDLDEIDFRGVDDEQRRGFVAEEEIIVGVVEVGDVLARHGALEVAPAQLDVLHQPVDRRLQVHHQVGLRERLFHVGRELVVEMQLVVLQVEMREDADLFENVIGDEELREQLLLRQRLQLLVAGEQEEELRLEGVALGMLVEALEEGIVLELLQHELAAEALVQQPRQAGLAGADHTFDRDVSDVTLHSSSP